MFLIETNSHKNLIVKSYRKVWLFFMTRITEVINLDYIQWIIEGRVDKFYKSRLWTNCRKKALERDHYECQMCKKNPKMNKIVLANTVHHIKEIRDYPHLALELDNLVSLCRACHERIHERDLIKRETKNKFVNEERW